MQFILKKKLFLIFVINYLIKKSVRLNSLCTIVFILVSIFTLVSAVYIEFILGAKPCKLCVYQRFPYIIAIFICYFGYTNLKQNLWLYLLSTTFLISLILSGYHFGIENNFFPEFSGCSASNLNITNKEDLLKSLNEIVPNCKDVTFKILGFSLATINVLISGLIMIISTVILKYEKNR